MRERVVADCTGLPVPSLLLHSRLFLVAFPCARVLNCKCVNCQLSDCQTESAYPIALPPAPSSPPPSYLFFLFSPLCQTALVCVLQWGCLRHGACCPICCNFLGTFLSLCLQLTLQFVKVTPAPPTSTPSAPPAAITPTSVINHAPCSKCSGASLCFPLSLSVCLSAVAVERRR